MSDENKIHIDSDWKAEAQAEKERLTAEQTSKSEVEDTAPKGYPPADFKGLMGLLASQAIMGLGAMQDPDGRGLMIDLEGARYAIDMLAVVEDKTKGNLSEEESKELETIIPELRARYVQITELMAQQSSDGISPQSGGSLKIPGMPES